MPGRLLGTLASGLRDDSRTMQAIGEQKCNNQTILLARISDQLTYMGWDGKGHKPERITDKFIKKDDENECVTFKDGAAFEEYKKKFMG